MIIRNAARAICLVAATTFVAEPAPAALPADLREGTRVEAEGRRLDDHSFSADEIEVQAHSSGKDEIAGPITAVDVAAGTLRIHAATIRPSAKAAIAGANGATLTLSDFSVGQYAQAEGVFRDGELHAEELELSMPDPADQLTVELSGIITKVNRSASSFEILGVEVMVTPTTIVEMR